LSGLLNCIKSKVDEAYEKGLYWRLQPRSTAACLLIEKNGFLKAKNKLVVVLYNRSAHMSFCLGKLRCTPAERNHSGMDAAKMNVAHL